MLEKEKPSVIIGVGVIARNEEGKILMKLRTGSHGKGEWALPGGQVEFGESFEDAATRELEEETGISASNARVVSLSNQRRYVADGVHRVIIGVEVEIPKGAVPENKEPEKCERFDWFTSNDLPKNIFEGSKQIIAAVLGEGTTTISYLHLETKTAQA